MKRDLEMCSICGTPAWDMRPYGPKGEPICFICAGSPSKSEEIQKHYESQMRFVYEQRSKKD